MTLGRNDPCWCGSGKKYKKCHLGRERQEPLPLSDILNGLRKAQVEICLHPESSPQNCTGKPIGAHTVPRSSLRKIAHKGHVYHFSSDLPTLIASDGQLSPKLIGINKASTFTGFCSRHDATFAPFETGNYESLEQASFLLAYRAVCVELYKKIGSASTNQLDKQLDRGRGLIDQISIQSLLSSFHEGNDVGLRDLRAHKHKYDDILISQDLSDVRYLLMELEEPPSIMCSGAIYPEFGFNGEKLQNLLDLKVQADIVTFSSLADKESGWLLFSWISDTGIPQNFVSSLCRIESAAMIHAVARFIFESFENTYMAPSWWEPLKAQEKDVLLSRMRKGADPAEVRPSNYLADDGLRLVHWKVKNIYDNFRTASNAPKGGAGV